MALEIKGSKRKATALTTATETPSKKMKQQMTEEDDDDDQSAALLAGFDSDGDDFGKDEGLDPANMGDLSLDKKQRKKLRQAARKGDREGPGSVYVGRIPHGFFEREMRQYFSQFGIITRLRLSRNKRTGASKHFAFVEFESNEVAKIVAETMDNYLMFGHILKCKYVPTESLHPDTYKGANKRFKKVPFNKIEKRRLEEGKTKDQWDSKIEREQAKRAKKAEKLKSIGYEFDMPQIQSVDAALEQRKLMEQEKLELIEPAAAVEEPTKAIEPPVSVPEDVVSLKQEKKRKKNQQTAPGEGSGLSAAPAETDIPKFAIHPDEIAELTQPKPKKSKKSKSTS